MAKFEEIIISTHRFFNAKTVNQLWSLRKKRSTLYLFGNLFFCKGEDMLLKKLMVCSI